MGNQLHSAVGETGSGVLSFAFSATDPSGDPSIGFSSASVLAGILSEENGGRGEWGNRGNLRNAFQSLPTQQQEQIRHRWGSHFNEILSLSRETDPELFHEALFHLGQRLEREGRTEQAGLVYGTLLTPHPDPPPQGFNRELSRTGERAIPLHIQQQAQERLEVLNGGGSLGNQIEHMGRGFARQALDPGLLLGATGMGLLGRGVELIGMRWLSGTRAVNLFTRGPLAHPTAKFLGFAVEASLFPFAMNGANELLGRPVSWADMDHRVIGSWFFLGGMKFGGSLAAMASRRLGVPGLQTAGSIGGIMLGMGGEVLAGFKEWHGFSNFTVEALGTWANLQVAGRFSDYVFGGQISRMQHLMEMQSRQLAQRHQPSPLRVGEWARRRWGEWVDSITEIFNKFGGPGPLAAAAVGRLQRFPEAGKEVEARARPMMMEGESGSDPTVSLNESLARILREGITNKDDLNVVDEFLTALDPEFAQIVEATRNIDHEFQRMDSTEGSLGKTQITFSQSVDRRTGGPASGISLTLFEHRGSDPATLIHERIHAADFLQLPQEYQEQTISPIPRGDNLFATYRAILENRYWDEALAFGAEARLGKKFRERTGQNLFSFPVFEGVGDIQREIQAIYEKGNFAGLYEWVAHSEIYLPYKAASLYLALLMKEGAKNFPDWGMVLDEMGFSSQAGPVRRKKLNQFYEERIEPLLAKHGISIVLTSLGLNSRERELLESAKDYFTGYSTAEISKRFLERDFDAIVSLFGIFLGDSSTQGLTTFPARREIAESEFLPPRSLRMKAGRIEEIQEHPEAVADKVEVAGKFVGLLEALAGIDNEAIFEHHSLFLSFAERADPVSAARVYSLLLSLWKEKRQSDRFKIDDESRKIENEQGEWDLAFSLLRSGYREEGLAQIERAFSLYPLKQSEDSLRRRTPPLDLFQFHSLGHSHFAERYLDRLLELNQDLIEVAAEEARKPPSDLISSRNPLADISAVLFQLSKNFSGAQFQQYPETFRLKFFRLARRLWEVRKARMEAKIDSFRERFAPEVASYESVDELTALHPLVDEVSYKGTAEHRLVGVSERKEWILTTEDSPQFIIGFLSSPALFRMGLEFLAEFPQSFTKIGLYHVAAEKLPSDFNDRERLTFVENYSRAVQLQRKALERWGYVEEIGERRVKYEEKPFRSTPSFEASHFVRKHSSQLAGVLFGTRDAALRERGVQMLSGLPNDMQHYSNRHKTQERWLSSKQNQELFYRPALGRLDALLEHILEFSRPEQEAILTEIFQGLKKHYSSPHSSYSTENAYLNHLKAAVQLGFADISQEATQYWRETLEDSDTKRLLHREPLIRGRLMVPLFQAVLQGGEGLRDLLRDIENDGKGRAERFPLPVLLEGLEFLSLAEVSSRLPESEPILEGMARAAIRLYVRSLGEKLFTDQWVPLVELLKNMSLSPPVHDAVFSFLIEQATPEPGVMAKGVMSEAQGLWEGLQVIDFILGNPNFPKAEAQLLNRLARVLPKFNFSRTDPRSRGLAKGLNWIFRRIADDTLLHPDNQEKLQGLRERQAYQAAVKELFSFRRSPPPKIDGDLIDSHYAVAIQTGNLDFLRNLTDQARDLIHRQLHIRAGERWNFHETFFDEKDLSMGLLGQVYEDWRKACATGKQDLSQVLFEIWVPSKDSTEALAKQILYYRELINPSINLANRQRIYQELVQSGMVSSYAQRVHKKIPWAREFIFYSLILPVQKDNKLHKPYDELVYLGLSLPEEEAQALAERHRLIHHSGLAQWKMNPFNPYDWEIYAHYFSGDISPWKSKSEAWTDALKNLRETLQKIIDRNPPTSEGSEADLNKILSHFSRIPSPQEAEWLLNYYEPVLRRHLRAQDRIEAEQLDTPKFFQNRDRLSKFLMIRFFLTLSSGEQQNLLKALQETKEEEGLRVFFEKSALEKIGQFLSYWPEVPAEIRAELTSLQDQIEASPIDDVRKALRENSWHKDDEWNSLLAHLHPTPLGSGSIGEVYLSQLADGTKVVVKVSPDSKRARFRKSLERLQDVQRRLELNLDTLPHAREAHRLISLYFEMVEKELDLTNELENGKRAAQNLPEGLSIPGYIDELTRHNVLVQRFAGGWRLDKIQDPAMREAALDQVKGFLWHQVMEKGEYHSDLQPGNLLVDPNTGTVFILDFGQAGTLTLEQRSQLQRFILARQQRDPAAIVETLEGMGDPEPRYDRTKLQAEVRAMLASGPVSNSISEAVTRLYQACYRRGLLIQLPYLQVLKAVATFEATAATTRK